jgi:hypothetical protein
MFEQKILKNAVQNYIKKSLDRQNHQRNKEKFLYRRYNLPRQNRKYPENNKIPPPPPPSAGRLPVLLKIAFSSFDVTFPASSSYICTGNKKGVILGDEMFA